jgi:hypothetical protein
VDRAADRGLPTVRHAAVPDMDITIKME